ncbi:MAG: 5-formyltetrahydrofolate cyclo-ligase [Litorimonas sp.]
MTVKSRMDIDKKRARLAAKTIRKSIYVPNAAEKVITHFPFGEFPNAVTAGFWPLAGEIDIVPLLDALQKAGHKLVLPCTPPAGDPLIFRQWEFGEDLKTGVYDTREPFSGKPEIMPDLVFVPLLAFTPQGQRLGYGGGFYDRTIAKMRTSKSLGYKVFACGVAYAGQQTSNIPVDQYDQTLDGILTEQYFRKFT